MQNINQASLSALRWINNNKLYQGKDVYNKPMYAMRCWHGNDNPYPEVTGYLIPTLLNYGQYDLAHSFVNYLLHSKHSNNIWPGIDHQYHVFDISAVIEGLLVYCREGFGSEKVYYAAMDARDWILEHNVDVDGKLISKSLTNPYPIYLARVASIIDLDNHYNFISQWIDWSLDRPERTHYIAYMLEGFINCGLEHLAKNIIDEMPNTALYPYQYEQNKQKWFGSGFCYIATTQMAMIYGLLGDTDRQHEIISELIRLQNVGGAFGTKEESWTVKFFLDALWLTGEIEL